MSLSRQERRRQSSILLVCLLVQIACFSPTLGFSSHSANGRNAQCQSRISTSDVCLFSSVEDKKKEASTLLEDPDDEETPAGIAGAEFFGGNKQKEELYDAEEELLAGQDIKLQAASYNRFSVSADSAFDSVEVASIAQSLQRQINQVLYKEDEKLSKIINRNDEDNLVDVNFGRSLSWETPITKSSADPMKELHAAKDFYNEVDLAIVGGKQISEGVVELFWELSLVWPTFWSPRVILAGASTCTVASDAITKQVDRVFGAENNVALISLLGDQIKPRFWDWYHIGMTPSAEQVPREVVDKKGGFTVYKIPPQLVAAPTIIETGTRENRHAEMVPNHAFSCVIRTMGPQKESYIPTTPVEVQIGKNTKAGDDDNRLRLSWSVPLSTQFQAVNKDLLLPAEENPEDVEGSFPTSNYSWRPLRQVATTKYGGSVQDPEISEIRKKLYEKVIKEGFKPKVDENGKPRFFFWQNDVKACYIEDGLGMCVYDWRPKFADSNEIGIELMVE